MCVCGGGGVWSMGEGGSVQGKGGRERCEGKTDAKLKLLSRRRQDSAMCAELVIDQPVRSCGETDIWCTLALYRHAGYCGYY